ncbi:hypothetical protein [Xanthomonas nasturtii]|uniref:hypothetical protein n=1 Tax=Xanthomonas nasturtii TaxID=1843581 RepID=UPI001EFBE911|nr:hypothetical protein [Xanthomonas nasturtii]WVL58856.1 hypothetical protein M3O54_006030 [Xanthomonas nasturtii]
MKARRIGQPQHLGGDHRIALDAVRQRIDIGLRIVELTDQVLRHLGHGGQGGQLVEQRLQLHDRLVGERQASAAARTCMV